MPAITSSNLAEAILRYVAAETMPALVGQLMMGNLVYRNFEATINQAGASVDIPIPPVMTANNIAETGSVQLQAPNLGNANISLDSHVEASFQIPDVVAAIGHPELIKLYSGPALNAVAERMETDILSLASAFTANTPAGAYNTAITEATVDTAETTLFNAKVPQSEAKVLVVDGTTYSTLRQLTRFSEYRTAGEAGLAALFQGQVARMKDFYVFRSQFVPKSGNNTTNFGFHRNAVALATRKLPPPIPGTGAIVTYMEMGGFGFRLTISYNPNTLAQQFTIDTLYGVGIIRNNHGIQVRS